MDVRPLEIEGAPDIGNIIRRDVKLKRLTDYIYSTYHWREVNWMGDRMEDLSIHLYPDADFGGCQTTSTSTRGCYFCVTVPNTRSRLSTASKAQTVVSHSTPEAELVSADYGLRQFANQH